MFSFVEKIGHAVISFVTNIGNYFVLLIQIFRSLFRKNFPWKVLLFQIQKIGYESIAIVAFTSFFMGMVFAFSTGVYLDAKLKGVAAYTGGSITIAFIREMGPVLTALLLSGRSGSSAAAEIGTMIVYEQIDAMVAMGIRPVQYVILPRIVAGILVTPILVFIADLLGILGGLVVAMVYLGQTPDQYFANVFSMLELSQVLLGFIKSLFFGFLILYISCARGYFVHGGSEAVGEATTQAVVLSSIICVIADYFITSILGL